MNTKHLYLRLCTYYFLVYSAGAAFFPYFNWYLQDRGLSGTKIGLVLSLVPFAGLIVQPVWGVLNDRLHVTKIILLLGVLVAPTVILSFDFIHSFLYLIFGTAVFAVLQSPITPVADSETVAQTGETGYGRVRMFGSLGYALLSYGAAILYHARGIKFLGLVFMVLSLLAAVGLLFYPTLLPSSFSINRRKPNHMKTFIQSKRPIRSLLKNVEFSVVLISTFFGSIGESMSENYFTLYYHALNRPMSHLGFMYGIAAISEVPFFFIVDKLIARFGTLLLLIVGTVIFIIRWVVLIFNPNDFIVTLQASLNGASFGITFAAGVAFCAEISEETNRTTARSLYSSVNTGLSAVIGSLVGGELLSLFGTRAIYEWSSAFGIISVIGLLALYFSLLSIKKRSQCQDVKA